MESPQLLPGLLTVESLFGALFDPVVWADPYPLFAELRERSPVTSLGDHHWVVAGHAEVREVLLSKACSSDERRGNAAAAGEVDSYPQVIRELFLFMDPPDHTRLRNLVVRAFTPRQVREIEPRANAIVARLLAEASQKSTFDIVGDFGQPLAVEVICELLGVPFADRFKFSGWGDAIARLIDPGALRTPEQDEVARHATEELCGYFDDLIQTRRSSPGDDLLSQLIEVEEDGDRLDRAELVSVCLLLLIAGFETTINLIGNGLMALTGEGGAYRRLADEPEVAVTAVNECLRIDSPVQMNVRIALEDLVIGAKRIPAGDSIVSFLGAANRDPRVFDRPDRFDIDRADNPHLAFGAGIHHCLGAALARTEAVAALAGLARTMPDLRIVEAERRPTFTLRGYNSIIAEPR